MNINIVCKYQDKLGKYATRKALIAFIIMTLLTVPSSLFYVIATSFSDYLSPIKATIGFCVIWVIIYLIARVSTKKTLAKVAAAHYKYCEHTFCEEGMDYKSYNYIHGVNSFVPYSAFKRVYFNKKNLVLYGATLIYVISRKDISTEYEDMLIKLFSSHLSPKVFRQKSIPKNRSTAQEVVLSPYVQPVFTFPEVRSLEHAFDKNAELYVKTIRFKQPPKRINPKAQYITIIAALLVLCGLLALLYFVDGRDNATLGILSFFIMFICLMSYVYYLLLKNIYGKDARGREGAAISMSINEFFINYKIVKHSSNPPEVSSYYFAIDECLSIKETSQFFAFYVGIFQPMLLNKKYLSPEGVDILRQMLFSRYGKKYVYYNI